LIHNISKTKTKKRNIHEDTGNPGESEIQNRRRRIQAGREIAEPPGTAAGVFSFGQRLPEVHQSVVGVELPGVERDEGGVRHAEPAPSLPVRGTAAD